MMVIASVIVKFVYLASAPTSAFEALTVVGALCQELALQWVGVEVDKEEEETQMKKVTLEKMCGIPCTTSTVERYATTWQTSVRPLDLEYESWRTLRFLVLQIYLCSLCAWFPLSPDALVVLQTITASVGMLVIIRGYRYVGGFKLNALEASASTLLALTFGITRYSDANMALLYIAMCVVLPVGIALVENTTEAWYVPFILSQGDFFVWFYILGVPPIQPATTPFDFQVGVAATSLGFASLFVVWFFFVDLIPCMLRSNATAKTN
jgi:hypothetical protein